MWWMLVLWACSGGPPPTPADEALPATTDATTAIDIDDHRSCAGCHAQVVQEWEQSMHARAHHERDPIYGSMRDLRIAKQGEAMGEKCLTCHSPRDPGNPSSDVAKAGVSCAACHAVQDVDRSLGMGAAALVRNDKMLLGPHDLAPGASPAHGTGKAPAHLTDGATLCLSCHDATQTPSGEAACTTGPEHAETSGDDTCVSCHMPKVQGPSGVASTRPDHATHAFLGPHRAWLQDDPSMLASGIDVSITRAGDQARVTLVNKAGHAFPTGFPGRLAVVIVRGMDAEDQVVWKNITDNPMTDAPEAVLNKVYVDDAGTPTPAAFATKLARDNRLKPGETRTLSWTVPEDVATLSANVMFRLLPPPLAATLGIADAPEATPRVIATAVDGQ